MNLREFIVILLTSGGGMDYKVDIIPNPDGESECFVDTITVNDTQKIIHLAGAEKKE